LLLLHDPSVKRDPYTKYCYFCHCSVWSARWILSAASIALLADPKAAQKASPTVLNMYPPWPWMAERRISSWRLRVERIPVASRSHSLVEPSMSVNRKVPCRWAWRPFAAHPPSLQAGTMASALLTQKPKVSRTRSASHRAAERCLSRRPPWVKEFTLPPGCCWRPCAWWRPLCCTFLRAFRAEVA
jgi:hypothetical protein